MGPRSDPSLKIFAYGSPEKFMEEWSDHSCVFLEAVAIAGKTVIKTIIYKSSPASRKAEIKPWLSNSPIPYSHKGLTKMGPDKRSLCQNSSFHA